MTSKRIVMVKLARMLLLVSAVAAFQAGAQTTGWDNTGNGMLNGTYYFRQVIYQLSNAGDGSLADAASLYGTVTFSGTGTYTMNVTLADLSSGHLQQGTISGPGYTYSIASSGQGFLVSPLFKGDYIFGLVNAQGIFVGSSTENTSGYHDLFIAAPLASPALTASAFKGSYTMAYMDLSSGTPLSTIGALAQMNPDGVSNVGTVPVSGYVGQSGSNKITQSLSSVKYIFSNGAAVVTFPNSNSAFFSGQYYLYFSPDGNFVFGGSPVSADMFVGVRNATGTPNLSGLYYETGIDQNESTLSNGYASPDTYYGSFVANSGAIIGHQRLIDFLNNGAPINYTYSDSYQLASNGTYGNSGVNYVVGANNIRIASGIGPFLSLSVALPAPVPSTSISPSGVFLNPTGVVNAGSFAPFTAGIAPGELLVIYGNNMSSGTQVASSVPFPTTLGNTQVKINGTPAPLYYVTPTQLSAIVPYSVTSGVAQIQVINNNTASNTVTMQIATTAPGALTQTQNGLGYPAAIHQDGSLVTAKNPAQMGETISIFVTGLGAVNPSIPDGAPGPTDTLSNATAKIVAYVGGTTASVPYAGLAPGYAGLYQLNVTIPSGLTNGDNNLDLSGPDSYNAECLLPVGTAASSSASPTATQMLRRAPHLKESQRLTPAWERRPITIPASR
jgi:uncharacterized protein (TIGR03437 family)